MIQSSRNKHRSVFHLDFQSVLVSANVLQLRFRLVALVDPVEKGVHPPHSGGELAHTVRPCKGGIDKRTLDSLKKGRNITLVTLSRLCRIPDCTPNEIVEIERE